MIEDFKQIVETMIANSDPYEFSDNIDMLTEKYGVCRKTVYNRFKSMFGDSPRDYVSKILIPKREDVSVALLNTTNMDEMRKYLDITRKISKGLLDKYYGVSTHKSAVLKVLSEKMLVEYKPVREDNRSIIYSQLLGDGSYYSKRHALRITHGIKQLEYLKFKVNLLNAGYPETSTNVRVCTHTQGHMFGDYWTKLGNVDIPSEEDCVSKLTPLGWMLWFFDDGCYTQDLLITCKRNDEVRHNAVAELATYGIESRDNGVSVVMRGKENSLKFFMNFIFPFISIIPQCMIYKVEDIVEMTDIKLSDYRK